MNYVALASGSKGNCHALSDSQRILLVDAGISLKQIRTRILAAGWNPAQIEAVALSHEHSDHISAVPVILRNTNWLFMVTKATLAAISSTQGIDIPSNRIVTLRPGYVTNWKNIRIMPFSIPHDAVDPVAFRIELNNSNVAIVTDLGHQTAIATTHCLDLDLLVLEANHDINMLKFGEYPPALKSRILGKFGHLSNESMCAMLSDVMSTRLKAVVLAHLSAHNNNPAIVESTARTVLKNTKVMLYLAKQHEPLLTIAIK